VEYRSTFAQGWELHLERIAETIELAADADIVTGCPPVGIAASSNPSSERGQTSLRFPSEGRPENKGILHRCVSLFLTNVERHESVEERSEKKLREKLPKLKDRDVGQFMSQ